MNSPSYPPIKPNHHGLIDESGFGPVADAVYSNNGYRPNDFNDADVVKPDEGTYKIFFFY